MKKILFTDLDGTLLTDDKRVSDHNRAAIDALLASGNYLTIATGRPTVSAFDVADALGLNRPGCYMIAFNGAVICDCATKKILKQHGIPKSDVRYLFEEAKRYGIHIQTYQGDDLITEQDTPELRYYCSRTTVKHKVVPDLFSEWREEPHKVLLASISDQKLLEQFQKDHMEWEKGRCNSFFSCAQYLEYCPAGVDKGSGIAYLADYLQVEMGNTYAVGDERNDIPMLRAAGTGIAMRNAHPDAKMAADYITEKDNEHDAISEIIVKFGLDRG